MNVYGFAAGFRWFVCVIAATSLAVAKVPVEAKQHMDAGLSHIDDPAGPRYEEAYREFHTAYEIYPAYELLANIGTCALYLERDAEAIEAYEGYLQKASGKDIPQKKRTLMERDIATLKSGLVRIEAATSPAKLTLIDERFASQGKTVVNRYEVSNGKASLGLHPGSHRITAHLDGYDDQHWEFDAKPASKAAHEFKLVAMASATPAKPSATAKATADTNAGGSSSAFTATDQPTMRPVPTAVYVGLGATGLFAVGSVITGVLANSKRTDFILVNDGAHVDQARDRHDAMKRYALVSDIAFGAAIVSAGVTEYLYFTRPSITVARQGHGRAYVNVEPSLGIRSAGIRVGGQF